MAEKVISCPNCGGDIHLSTSNVIHTCPYCDSEIVSDFVNDRKDAIVGLLIAAKNALESSSFDLCNQNLEKAGQIESDCSDIWYMKAAMYANNIETCKVYLERGRSARVGYNVFTDADVSRFRNNNFNSKKDSLKIWILIVNIIILFFGGTLSLGLGIGLETLTPLYVTLALLVVANAIFIIVICVIKRKS